ncbi:hypothetical protein BV210_11265 [Halorientalis sp. IM1011]|uniref:hypothetical protein n=1 Tax=Halorientalis sp. IM1011 TaxID=1932360 RepID=UPI00097CCCB8|nr:hypothetical protein [Halorientalis sp. IM1011]AQL43262.1 hypothetical protein BV210_11265 [Halorientalis sp. IM1011]
MELTRSVVESKSAEYRAREPLYPVEQEGIDIFPEMFRTGSYGWRDAEWVVRWYYRRFLGEVPHEERQRIEDQFATNEFETVRAVIDDAVSAAEDTAAIERLTDLAGVDVPVASAFLQFVDPETAIVIGEREWTVLEEADELSAPYPNPPSVREYERYLDTCRELAERLDCDCWTLYMALWRLWKS